MERQELIRNSTVKVLVEGTTYYGTGFFINENGYVLTALHIIASALLFSDGQNQLITHRNIIVEKHDGTQFRYRLEEKISTIGAKHAIEYDYCLLIPDQDIPKTKIFLNLGRFEDILVGDQACTCGYPEPGTKQVITTGKLIEKQSMPSEMLLFDMRTFKGNSGGPIVRIGKTTGEDVVVGLASYVMSQSQDKSKDGLCIGVSINYFHNR